MHSCQSRPCMWCTQMGTLLTLLPVLLLTQIRHMRHLVPLSVTAFSLLGGAMAAVGWLCVIRLYSQSENPLPPPPPYRQSQLVPFFASVVYCFEGIGIILPIEDSMRNRQRFPHILVYAMITVLLVTCSVHHPTHHPPCVSLLTYFILHRSVLYTFSSPKL